MRGKIKNIVSVIAILLMANSLIHIGSSDIKNVIDKIGGYIVCCVAMAIVLFGGRLLLAKEKERARYSKKVIVCDTLILFALINCIAPLKYAAYRNLDTEVILQATGEKNKASKGTEVWIKSIKVDGNEVDLESLAKNSDFEAKNGKLVSYENQPQQLQQIFTHTGNIQIEMIKHPYSGKAIVSIGNEKSEVDLYSDKESTTVIEARAQHDLIIPTTVIVYIGWLILEVLISEILCLFILLVLDWLRKATPM